MITTLKKSTSRLAIIYNIPKSFFNKIEVADSFTLNLFPKWANEVLGDTSLFDKFEKVFNKYKAIKSATERQKIIDAFSLANPVDELCGDPTKPIIELKDLHHSIRGELDTLFLFLYNNSLKYKPFNDYIKDTVSKLITRYKVINRLSICPFCGIETIVNIEGQARLPLDHWIAKDLYPMSSVNFKNLFPIGKDCNPRPVKGDKNVLMNEPKTARVVAYYPLVQHHGFSLKFRFIKEPTGEDINESDWFLDFNLHDLADQDIYDSWKFIFNITRRYRSYMEIEVLGVWESIFFEYIEAQDDLQHATSIEELKDNLQRWKGSFQLLRQPGAIIYRAFIDYLLNDASEAYLYSLTRNFQDRAA